MILEVVILSFVCPCLILMVRHLISKGSSLRSQLERLLPWWLFDPIIGCPYCMASGYGAAIYLAYSLLYGTNYPDWVFLPWWVFTLLVNGIFFELKERYID